MVACWILSLGWYTICCTQRNSKRHCWCSSLFHHLHFYTHFCLNYLNLLNSPALIIHLLHVDKKLTNGQSQTNRIYKQYTAFIKHQHQSSCVMQWRRHLVHVIVVQYSVGGEYIGGLLWVMIDYYHIITITLPRNAFRDGINIQQTGVCTSPLMQVNIRVPIFWHRYFDWTLNLQRRHFTAWRDYMWRHKLDWRRLP